MTASRTCRFPDEFAKMLSFHLKKTLSGFARQAAMAEVLPDVIKRFYLT